MTREQGDDTVYVAVTKNGVGTRTYHTDPDCPKLARADMSRPRDRFVLAEDHPVCKQCSGEAEQSEPWQGGHYQALVDAAKDGGEIDV